MCISKRKAAFALLKDGTAGIIKYFLDVSNEQVLARIPNKDVGLKYLKDVSCLYVCLRSIMENHATDISERCKACLESILATMEELTLALEDFNVNETEFKSIVEKAKVAIDAFKKSP